MGYDVYAVVDASGAWSKQIEEVAIARMQAEGRSCGHVGGCAG